jgi:hypothetical protein
MTYFTTFRNTVTTDIFTTVYNNKNEQYNSFLFKELALINFMPKPPKQILARSYFYKYIPNSPYKYCMYCDEILMTPSYVDEHLKTNKHNMNIHRLNRFINANTNNFVKEDINLLNEVFERYDAFVMK